MSQMPPGPGGGGFPHPELGGPPSPSGFHPQGPPRRPSGGGSALPVLIVVLILVLVGGAVVVALASDDDSDASQQEAAIEQSDGRRDGPAESQGRDPAGSNGDIDTTSTVLPGGVMAFCRQMEALRDVLILGDTTAAAREDLVNIVNSTVPPAEIAEEWSTFADAVVRAYEGEVLSDEESAELVEVEGVLEGYVLDECGIDMG